jgi:hypothetical protein
MINGPYNIVRLEGNVGLVKKVIYICYDFHRPSNIQTKYDNIHSINIDEYLEKSFTNSTKNITYDFFFEIKPTKIYDLPKDNRYVDTVKKFFVRMFNYDNKSNTVLRSNLLDNVRFHYMDVRDIIYKYEYGDLKRMYNIINKSAISDPEKFNKLIVELLKIKNHILMITSCFKDYDNVIKKKHD